jgi:O-acetylserine/cysteine efflux transporter
MTPLDLGLQLVLQSIWGVNFAVTKVGLAQFPPLMLVALRFCLTALLLLPFVPRPNGRMRAIFSLSVTLGLIHFSLFYLGLRGVDAATAAIAVQLQVPFAAFLAWLLFRERLGWRRLAGMGVALLGVAILAGEPRTTSQLGSLAVLILAIAVWAGANLQIKRLAQVDGLTLNAYVALFAAPMLAAASWAFEHGQIEAVVAADAQGWFSVFYQAVLVTIVGYGIWYRHLGRYAINQVMPFTLLVPVIGAISGWTILGEPVAGRQIVGGLVTVLGVAAIVAARAPRR